MTREITNSGLHKKKGGGGSRINGDNCSTPIIFAPTIRLACTVL